MFLSAQPQGSLSSRGGKNMAPLFHFGEKIEAVHGLLMTLKAGNFSHSGEP